MHQIATSNGKFGGKISVEFSSLDSERIGENSVGDIF